MPPEKKSGAQGKNAPKNKKVASDEPPPPESGSEESDFEEEEGGVRIAGVYVPPAPTAVCSVESTGPRLIITHIANENFKSYAGRQVLGPFHQSFTGIIGPNGSGKSNVIDSMLFVFGYRATKIRSKKISVLLHKSENHQNVMSATVEVHFQLIVDKENEEYEAIPNSKFYISRTAFQDSSSHYTINGKRAKFKDVAQVLGSHGIDLKHNRFLILQGEVEQIAMMKPKGPNEHESGMLEYLEDIIGTSRYKRPIEKLDGKVNLFTEERQEKLNRAQLADKEKEALKEHYNKALEYLGHLNNLSSLYNKLYQREILSYTDKLESMLEHKETLEKEVAEKKETIKVAQEHIAEKEKIINARRKENEGLKTQKEKLIDSFNKVENRATQLKEEITLTNKKRKKAIEAKKQEEKKLADLEKIPEKNEKEIEELKVMQEKLQKSREKEEIDLQGVLESLKAETQGLQEKKDEISNILIGLNKKREDARAKYELSKTELSVYLSNEKKEKEKLEKLRNTLANTLSQLEEKKKILHELEIKTPQVEQSLVDKQKELDNLRKEETHVMQELNHQRSIMEEKKHSLSASVSRNRVIKFLMELKENGEIPGIFGRLGDLGGIDAKYDCAVSTACGPLDHVVVDNSTTAKHCINALKRSNVGRGNFIALDQQNKFIPNCQQHFVGPENVPRLFDLIRVEDERLKPAFYFALKNTLVAENLSQARRVAYGATRYRVVTLNGEIIEIAGTMSGGGQEKRTGRMGRSATVKTDVASPGAMAKLEEKVRQLQERAAGLHQRINVLEPEIATLTRELRKCKMELSSSQMEVKNLSQQEPSLMNQITNQEAVVAKTVSDPEIVEQKTKLVETLKNDFEFAAAESGQLEKEVAEVTSKINAIAAGKMQAAQDKLDHVSKQLDKITTDITKLTVAIKTSDRNCKKSKDRIQSLTTEITEAEENLTRAQEENISLDEEAKKVNEFIQTIAEKLLQMETGSDDVKAEVSKLNKEISTMKASLLVDGQRAEEISKELIDVKNIIKKNKDKLAALKLEPIPDDESSTELYVYSNEELRGEDPTAIDYQIQAQKEYTNRYVNVDPKVIDLYQEKSRIFKERQAELDEVTEKRNEARQGVEELRKARLTEFMKGYLIISYKLKEMYQMITFGGDAELELIDSLDPFSEGIGFSVRPPKKSWKHISNLSGGEKTLSSLALVFALHYYKPSPLYVMDEIDAALDFKNVSIVGHYIKERTKNAQFIIISLRPNMFELADVLVGIYKTENCTKSVTITPKLYASSNAQKTDNHHDKNKQLNDDDILADEATTNGDEATTNGDEAHKIYINSLTSDENDVQDDFMESSQISCSESSDNSKSPPRKRQR